MATNEEMATEIKDLRARLGIRTCSWCGTVNPADTGDRPQPVRDESGKITGDWAGLRFYDVEGVVFCEPCAPEEAIPEWRKEHV